MLPGGTGELLLQSPSGKDCNSCWVDVDSKPLYLSGCPVGGGAHLLLLINKEILKASSWEVEAGESSWA